MAKNFYKQISEDIESGKYFQDARQWYHTKYSFPVIERSYFMLISIASVLIAIISINIMIGFFPLMREVPVAVSTSSEGIYYPTIDLMTPSRDDDPDIMLQRYILGKYIHSYEDYDFIDNYERMNNRIKFIKKYSNESVLNQYLPRMERTNSSSYLVKYKKFATRNVDIITSPIKIDGSYSAKLFLDRDTEIGPDGKKNIHNAVVKFYANENYLEDASKDTIRTKWQADIRYKFSDIAYKKDTNEFEELDFKVLNYKVKKIEQ